MQRASAITKWAVLCLALIWAGSTFAQSDEGVLFELGAADAKVEVIEVVSLGCPTCKSFHRDGGTFEVFRDSYIAKGHVRWVIRDHFWTKFDFWTSRIVRCGDVAGREARMAKVLERQAFIAQDRDPQGVVNRLVAVAGEMGITPAAANACLQDAVGAELHVTTHRIFLERYGLVNEPRMGTPFFIVDGEPVWFDDHQVDYQRVNAAIARRLLEVD